jgi:DNA-binding CsgD family transcriptional regulator
VRAVVGVRSEPEHLQRVFDRSAVPMVMADDRRRHIEVNLAARLVLRLSMGELGRYRIDDLTPVEGLPSLEAAWTRLLETGSAAGRHEVVGPDGSRLQVRYWAVSNVRPTLHLIAFAPATWSERELRPGGACTAEEPVQCLTSREREVLQLAADGLSGPGIAHVLVISHATVRAHFRNIYEKLGVGERPAAVATALRLGLIA